jgi:hypothetical protein
MFQLHTQKNNIKEIQTCWNHKCLFFKWSFIFKLHIFLFFWFVFNNSKCYGCIKLRFILTIQTWKPLPTFTSKMLNQCVKYCCKTNQPNYWCMLAFVFSCMYPAHFCFEKCDHTYNQIMGKFYKVQNMWIIYQPTCRGIIKGVSMAK